MRGRIDTPSSLSDSDYDLGDLSNGWSAISILASISPYVALSKATGSLVDLCADYVAGHDQLHSAVLLTTNCVIVARHWLGTPKTFGGH